MHGSMSIVPASRLIRQFTSNKVRMAGSLACETRLKHNTCILQGEIVHE